MSSDLHGLVAHQFDDMEQQREAATIGMWAFLITEVMLFGGMFMCYTVYRTLYPEAFQAGSHHLNIILGTLNTALLIGSSLTMALAVHAAQNGHRKQVERLIVATILLGSLFLAVKAFEYTGKWQENLIPGPNFAPAEPIPHLQIFYALYFVLTGTHAFHMVIGIGVMVVMLVMNRGGKFSKDYYAPVEMAGLYWHFVDIVWIFLFPLLYLLGRH